MNTAKRIFSALILFAVAFGLLGFTVPATAADEATVWADRVVRNNYVILEASDLPSNTRVQVLFSRPNTAVSRSIKVGTAYSDRYGDLRESFDIPKQLYQASRIIVRLRIGNEIVAKNWFYNASEDEDTGGRDEARGEMYIRVVEVDRGDDITIRGDNFPAKTRFNVYLGGRQGRKIKFTEVDTIVTNNNGRFEETFNIPGRLANTSRIAFLIRSEDGKVQKSMWINNK